MGLFSDIGSAFGFGGGSGGGVTGENWGKLNDNLGALKKRADGNYESQAQAQLKMAENQQRRQTQDATANMRALNPAEQAMTIGQANAELGANMAGQSANLRAQEDYQNQQMYQNALQNNAQLQLANNAQVQADQDRRNARRGALIGSIAGVGLMGAGVNPEIAKMAMTGLGGGKSNG